MSTSSSVRRSFLIRKYSTSIKAVERLLNEIVRRMALLVKSLDDDVENAHRLDYWTDCGFFGFTGKLSMSTHSLSSDESVRIFSLHLIIHDIFPR